MISSLQRCAWKSITNSAARVIVISNGCFDFCHCTWSTSPFANLDRDRRTPQRLPATRFDVPVSLERARSIFSRSSNTSSRRRPIFSPFLGSRRLGSEIRRFLGDGGGNNRLYSPNFFPSYFTQSHPLSTFLSGFRSRTTANRNSDTVLKVNVWPSSRATRPRPSSRKSAGRLLFE